MQLKLKQSIRCNGVQHRPPAVVDTKEIGISDTEAKVLIGRGVAELFEGEIERDQAPSAPVVTALGLGAVEGPLDGVVTNEGQQKDLKDLTKDEIIAIAKDMGIEFNSRTTKEQLIALIKAEPVSGDDDGADGGDGSDETTDTGADGSDTGDGGDDDADGADGDQGE